VALAAVDGVSVVATPDEIKAAEFNTALGNALSNWQIAEQRLALIFEEAAESKHALFIFEAITSTRDKLSVLDALLQRRLRNHELLRDWIRLYKKIGRMSLKRNKIVHGYPIKLPVAPVVLPIDANTEMEYFVGPSFSKSHLMIDPVERSKNFRNERQLKQLACAFDLLTVQIGQFSRAVSELLKRPEPS
jgi:hypothetical protein